MAWPISPEPDARPVFPPEVVVQVKALACELPFEQQIPLSRFSHKEIAREVIQRGIVADISGSTVWRWLSSDAIKPWQHRSWIFPRDPDFLPKATRVLDLYHRVWEGNALESGEFVVSADEKTSIQVRRRKHKTLPTLPGNSMKIEHEYERAGVVSYIAAWDVHRATVCGRCESRSSIKAFDRLVADVMRQQPYASAKRVFWIVDNGSVHRGQASIERLQSQWSNLVLVHLPVHASWLNQIEIYFSILKRKVLTPNYFDSLEQLTQTISAFQQHYMQTAKPFEWKYTKDDLLATMNRLSDCPIQLAKAV